jgi:hypothetical protein
MRSGDSDSKGVEGAEATPEIKIHLAQAWNSWSSYSWNSR